MEGVTGVTSYDQVDYEKMHYAYGQTMMMNDLQAAVNGLLSTGDHEIVVYDEHTDGRNIYLEKLDERVKVICGKPLYRPDWGGIDASYDTMIMVGFHARSKAQGALLPHTYSRKNLALKVNDQLIGEIGLEAAIAGDFGVPTWLVTGDSAGMKEAEADIPGVRTVVVKKAMGEFEALCFPAKLSYKLIYEAARKLILSPPDVKVLHVNPPIRLEITLAASDYLDTLKYHYPGLFIAENIVKTEGESVTEAWSKYLKIYREIRKL